MTVGYDSDGNVTVSGNSCPNGNKYAVQELTSPVRTVTSTVRITGGVYDTVSVKTREPVPKDKMHECILALKDIEVKVPVHVGDVIIKNAAGTGIDIVASGNATAV